jgi:UDP-glucose 4-epimerase
VRALNVESTRELLRLAERHPTIRRFVFRSHSDVYRVSPYGATLLEEDDALDLSAGAPQRVRNRVEADVTVCTRMGLSPLSIQVLRCAEILAPNMGSQLYDYLSSVLCLRPLGFDPMLNLLTIEDAARALVLALDCDAQGVFNIAGADTLPLSRVIEKWGRTALPVFGPLLAPLYRLRASALGVEFRYDMNHRRFHFSSVLDGRRAREILGYEPKHPIAWPTARPPAVEDETRVARVLRRSSRAPSA